MQELPPADKFILMALGPAIHDLRNNLMAVNGYIQLATIVPEEQKTAQLSQATSMGTKMSDRMESLSELGRIASRRHLPTLTTTMHHKLVSHPAAVVSGDDQSFICDEEWYKSAHQGIVEYLLRLGGKEVAISFQDNALIYIPADAAYPITLEPTALTLESSLALMQMLGMGFRIFWDDQKIVFTKN